MGALGMPMYPADDGSTSEGTAARPLEARVDEMLTLLRIWHLHNLYGSLGETEAKAIIVRLLAPAATIGWQLTNNFTEVSQRLTRLIGNLPSP